MHIVIFAFVGEVRQSLDSVGVKVMGLACRCESSEVRVAIMFGGEMTRVMLEA